MKSFMLIACLMALLSTCYDIKDGVYILDEESHDIALFQHSAILIYYCSPYSGNCKDLDNLFAKIEKSFKGWKLPIEVAFMDCTENPKVREEQNINQYPTVRLYLDSQPIVYHGMMNIGDIINFARKNLEGAVFTMYNLNEIDKFMAMNRIALLTTMDKNDKDMKQYTELALNNKDHYSFLHCITIECKEKYDSSKIVILRSFNDNLLPFTYTELTKEAIDLYMEKYSIEPGALLMGYTLDILYRNKTALLLFREEDQRLDTLYRAVAQEYIDKIYFITIDAAQNELNKKAASFFIVRKKDLPILYLLKVNGNNEDIYIMKNKEINEQNIKQFIDDYQNNRLVKELESEPIKFGYDGQIPLVGRIFEEEVFSGNKSFFVLFRKEDCDYDCKTFGTIWNTLAMKYHSQELISIAHINMDKNELNGISFDKYPTAVLYLKHDCRNPIVYQGLVDPLEIEDWMAWKLGLAPEPVYYKEDP